MTGLRVALFVGLGVVVGLPVLLVGGGVLVLRSDGGQAWAVRRVLALVQPQDGELIVGSVRTDLWTTIRVEGVSLRDRSGKELAGLDVAEADFSLREILKGTVSVSKLRGEGLRGDVRIDDHGVDIATIWGPPSTAPSKPWSGLGIDLLIDGIDLAATGARVDLSGEKIALTDIQLKGALHFEGDLIMFNQVAIETKSTEPDLGALNLVGGVTYGPEALRFDSVELDLGPHYASLSGVLGNDDGSTAIELESLHVDTAALPWTLPVDGAFDVTGQLGGTLDAPEASLLIGTPGGAIDVAASIDLRLDRPRWAARVDTIGFSPARFIDDVPETVVDASVGVSGEGITWPDDLDAHAVVDAAAPVAGPLGSSTLSAVIDLSDGVAWVRDLVATTPTGALSADATANLLASVASATVYSLDVDLADLGRFGAGGIAGQARLVGLVDAGWAGGEPEVRYRGTLDARSLRYQSTARVARLAGPVVVAWEGGAGSYSATLHANNLVASSAKLQRARLAVRGTATQAGAVRLQAAVHGDALGAGPATVSNLDARAQLALSSGGHLQTDVLFQTTALQAGSINGDRAAGKLSIVGDTLLATVDVYDGERTVLGADANGAMEAGHYELPRLIFSPDETQVWTGQGIQTVTLAPDGVDDLRVSVASGSAALEVTGSLHTRGDVGLDVNVVDLPLKLLRSFDPAFAGYTGLVGVTGRASGPWQAVELVLDGAVADLAVPGAVRGVDAAVAMDGRDGVVRFAGTVADSDGTLATLDGNLPVVLNLDKPALQTARPVDVTLDVSPGDEDRWSKVLDGVRLPDLRGGGKVVVTGTLLDPNIEAHANVELPPEDRREDWLAFDVDASTTDRALTLRATMSEGDRPLATLTGGAEVGLGRVTRAMFKEGPAVDLENPSTWVDKLDLTLTPEDLRLQALSNFVAVPDGVSGSVEGQVHLTGSPAAPVLDGDLSLRDGKLDDLAVSVATLAFSPASGGYDLAMDVGFAAEGDLRVAGFVPVDLDGAKDVAAQMALPGLKMEVSGSGLPLRAVSTLWPTMEEATGILHVAGAVSGSLAAPVADLKASTRDAAFRLTTTAVVYDEVRFDLTVAPDSVRLADLHVRTSTGGAIPDRGTVDGSAEASLAGTTIGEWKGNIKLDRTVISALDDRRLRVANGTLKLSGKPPNIVVGGSMKLEEGRLALDQRFFQGPTGLELPPWLRVHRPNSVLAAAPAAVAKTDLPAWLKLDFSVDLARQAFLRAELPLDASLGNLLGPFAIITVDTQADGQLKIGARDGRLSIVGQVLPVRGITTLFGKPFAIRDDSTISFTGADYAAPVLDLHATYDTRNYGLVEASIRGVPDALVVDLSSDDYPSQDDVISLLLIGKPASEVTAGEGASDGAGAAALSMVLNTLGQQGGKMAAAIITPDLLVVGDQTAKVGKRVGRSIFVVVDWDNTADDQTSSLLTLTVEIALWGAWQAEFVHGTAGEDSIGVNWTHRY